MAGECFLRACAQILDIFGEIISHVETWEYKQHISNLFSSITNEMQRYTIYLFLWNALHVSGGSSAQH